MVRSILAITTILLLTSIAANAEIPDSKAEALVNCPVLPNPEPLRSYAFATATVVSLWYARNASEKGNEMKEATSEATNPVSLMTAMMRFTKLSTNEFICAKRSMKPFVGKPKDEDDIPMAADLLTMIYDAHISINQRLLDLLKKLDRIGPTDLSDQMSTLEVERGQEWANLVQPTTLALASLIDMKRIDSKGTVPWLVITKLQKQTLLDWIAEHFPEFKDGTPREKWSDPAKTAEMYVTLLKGRKSTDE